PPLRLRRHSRPALFPYTTLFRSGTRSAGPFLIRSHPRQPRPSTGRPHSRSFRRFSFLPQRPDPLTPASPPARPVGTENRRETDRSEEHTSELQSRENLVCRLRLE